MSETWYLTEFGRIREVEVGEPMRPTRQKPPDPPQVPISQVSRCVTHHHGCHCREQAWRAEVEKRDARIAELETALRELTEAVASYDVRNEMRETTCFECFPLREGPVAPCSYHKARRVIRGVDHGI